MSKDTTYMTDDMLNMNLSSWLNKTDMMKIINYHKPQT